MKTEINTNKINRLNVNENPYNIPAPLLNQIMGQITEFNFNIYPDEKSDELRDELSKQLNVDKDMLICTNGSDELIKIIMDTFVTPGDTVLSHAPTFIEYKIMSDIRGGCYKEVLPNKDLSCDFNALIDEAEKQASGVIFLCSPNNPTGEIFTEDMITKVLEAYKGLVVVDEAYCEFSEQSSIPLLDKYPNLLIMRTLSKAFGLASLRIGYGIASKQIIESLSKNKMPYNLNALSSKIGAIAVRNSDLIYKNIDIIKSERDRMYAELDRIPALSYFKGQSNFILIKTSYAKKISDDLKSKNIMVRQFTTGMLADNYFRFSMSTPEINDTVIRVIKEYLQ